MPELFGRLANGQALAVGLRTSCWEWSGPVSKLTFKLFNFTNLMYDTLNAWILRLLTGAINIGRLGGEMVGKHRGQQTKTWLMIT